MGRPGRPRLPPEQHAVERTVRLSPAAFDVVCRLAQHEGLSANALMKRVLERVFTHQKILRRAEACYGRVQASTLSGVVGDDRIAGGTRD